MDAKDRLILYELDANSRATYSQISKKTKISQETVRYRLNNLLEQNVIHKFLAIFNTNKLGYSYYQILLKLQNMNQDKKSKIIDFLISNDKIAWVGNLEGSYDLSFIIYVQNQIELQKFINEFNEKYNQNIMKKTISINIRGEFFSRDYLINKERQKFTEIIYEQTNEISKLDDIDDDICSLLSENSRYTAVDLANRLNISADSVLQRLKKLKKEKILIGNSIIINQNKLNQSHHKVLLFLNNLNSNNEKKLLSYLRNNNRIIAIIKTLAEWDYELDIEVENFSQLENFTMNLTSEFSDIIKDYDVLRIKNMPKYTFFPRQFKNSKKIEKKTN